MSKENLINVQIFLLKHHPKDEIFFLYAVIFLSFSFNFDCCLIPLQIFSSNILFFFCYEIIRINSFQWHIEIKIPDLNDGIATSIISMDLNGFFNHWKESKQQ